MSVLRSAPVWLCAIAMMQSCAADPSRPVAAAGGGTALLVASPHSRVGGEARIDGTLQVRNGCVVVEAGGRRAAPIFDPTVRWTEKKDGILDTATGERIAIGARLIGSAAHMLDDGAGWSREEIERQTGVAVPQACANTIVRVQSIRGSAAGS